MPKVIASNGLLKTNIIIAVVSSAICEPLSPVNATGAKEGANKSLI